jgi:cold shock CspA family protein
VAKLGTVKIYHPERGFGFITDDTRTDYFFHFKDCAEHREIRSREPGEVQHRCRDRWAPAGHQRTPSDIVKRHYPKATTQREFARMLGVNPSTVSLAIASGRLDGACDENRRIRDIGLATKLFHENRANPHDPRDGVPRPEPSLSMSVAMLDKEKAIMAGNFRAFVELKSSLIDTETARAAILRAMAPVADRFRLIVDEAAPLASGQSQAGAVQAIKGAIHRALSHQYPSTAAPPPSHNHPGVAAPTPFESPALQLSNLRRDKLILQTKMLELKHAQEAGEAILIADVLGDIEDRLVGARQALVSLSDNIFMARSSLTQGEVRSSINREVTHAISILYRQANVTFPEPDLPHAPVNGEVSVTLGDPPPPAEFMTIKQMTARFNELAHEARKLGLQAKHHSSDFGDRIGGLKQIAKLQQAITTRMAN